MSVDRCPACAAAVPTGAPWCTLCWAPLRSAQPAAELVPEPAPEPVALPELLLVPSQPAGSPDPLPAPDQEPVRAAVAAPDALTWPCVVCHISIPIADDACPNCGRRFLQEPLSDRVGLIDRLPEVTANKGFNAVVIAAGSLGLTILIVGLLAVLGLFF